MVQRALLVSFLGLLCCGSAAPACAQPTFTPTTENERLLLEMLERQQDEIRSLRAQVERLTEAVEQTPTANVNEVPTVDQTRVSQVESPDPDGKVSVTQPGPKFESASGDHSLQIVGAIQADAAGYSQSSEGDATPKLHGGTNVRRAHFGVQGSTFRDFNYAFVYDFATTSSVTSGIRDAFASWVGLRPFVLTLGQQKPNVGLEPNFSDRSNASTFMEPGLSAALVTAVGTRNLGVRLSLGGDRYSASLGIFGEDASNSSVSSPLSEGWGPAGRVTFAPINAPGSLLHLGASGYWRRIGRASGGSATNPNFQLRYRAQPEISVDSARLLDTGVMQFGESVGLFGVETAGVYGPFSAQGEWVLSRVDQESGRPTLEFDGGYGLLSWFPSGESRVYEGRTGVFTRLSPKRNFSLSAGGWGAFEIAARCSYLDLDGSPNDWVDGMTLAGVRGGRAIDYTVGLNWYLNPFLRLMVDYVHADVENFTVPATEGAGVDEGGEADVFAIRVHQEW